MYIIRRTYKIEMNGWMETYVTIQRNIRTGSILLSLRENHQKNEYYRLALPKRREQPVLVFSVFSVTGWQSIGLNSTNISVLDRPVFPPSHPMPLAQPIELLSFCSLRYIERESLDSSGGNKTNWFKILSSKKGENWNHFWIVTKFF